MPATFRAFLQGLSAAMPKIIELYQWEQERKLQEEQIAGYKTMAEAQNRQAAVQERYATVAEKKYGEIEKPQSDLAQQMATVEIDIKKAEKDINDMTKEFRIHKERVEPRGMEQGVEA